jgi:dTDP-4-amino-4,6-dideoxygalactose transaminase
MSDSNQPIYVTRSFLPSLDQYKGMLDQIWERSQFTNHGPYVTQLRDDLQNLLGVPHVCMVNNGTIAIQVAIKALDLTGEVITTPFSYVATVSSMVWENCKPVFVDIRKDDFCIDASRIEAAITDKTTGILATHVYGHPCDVEAIEDIAKRHGLKVIYDAAHAFGVEINGRSILNYGDASTLSFHATKIFHCGEGGAIATNNPEIDHKLNYLRNFGHNGEEAFWGLGVNGKMAEPMAALGLCVLPNMDEIIGGRKRAVEYYDSRLAKHDRVYRYQTPASVKYTYSYYPILMESEELLLKVRENLNAADIFPRRYFYPPLHQLPYIEEASMPITESISPRMLCLPLYHNIEENDLQRITDIILQTLNA